MSQPLRGLRVGVTRSRSQASALVERLRAAGAEPVELPVLAFHPPDSWDDVDRALDSLDRYDGVLFTSTNAVGRTLERARLRGVSPGAFARPFVAASGTATGAVLQAAGIPVDLIPDTFHSEALVASLRARFGPSLAGTRWLLPRAQVAREVLPDGLRASGASVDVVAVYRTGPPEDPGPLRAALTRGLEVVTFASGSSVQHLIAAVGALPSGVAVVTIGPVTSAACRAAGLTVAAEAEEARLDALVDAIVRWRSP